MTTLIDDATDIEIFVFHNNSEGRIAD